MTPKEQKPVFPRSKVRQVGISTMTLIEQKQAYEQDALMDSIDLFDFEDSDAVSLYPNSQDPLTRAKELLREAAEELREVDQWVHFRDYTSQEKEGKSQGWRILATRISDFLKGEGG